MSLKIEFNRAKTTVHVLLNKGKAHLRLWSSAFGATCWECCASFPHMKVRVDELSHQHTKILETNHDIGDLCTNLKCCSSNVNHAEKIHDLHAWLTKKLTCALSCWNMHVPNQWQKSNSCCVWRSASQSPYADQTSLRISLFAKSALLCHKSWRHQFLKGASLPWVWLTPGNNYRHCP